MTRCDEQLGPIQGERVTLRPLSLADAGAMLELYQRNEAHLAPWDPARPRDFYSVMYQMDMIQSGLVAQAEGRGSTFGITINETGMLAGRITLSGIVRGIFQNAYLGYWLDKEHTGRGRMTEAVSLVVTHAFRALALHRVQAAVLPHNHASIRVLEKNGFRREGLAQRYLQIAGHWQDHVLFGVTVEEWPAW